MDVRRGPRRIRWRALAAAAGLLAAVELAAVAASPGRLRPAVLPFAAAEAEGLAGEADAPQAAGRGEASEAGGGAEAPQPEAPLADGPATPDPAAALAVRGVTFGPGWAPEGILGGLDPWSAFDGSEGAAAWVPHLTPRSELVIEGEPFRERAVVGRDPAPCYHFHRTVRDVSVGLAGPAGARIEADLLAWLEPPYFSGVVRTRLDPRCVGRPRSQYGFAIEEVWRVPCAAPPRRAADAGPSAAPSTVPSASSIAVAADLRCFVVGQWAYHLGERDVRWAAHLAYDAATGELLVRDELHVGVDVEAWRAFVADAVCELGGRCADVEHRHGQLLPTEGGLLVEFAAGEAADAALGTRRLVVPWAVVAELAARP